MLPDRETPAGRAAQLCRQRQTALVEQLERSLAELDALNLHQIAAYVDQAVGALRKELAKPFE